MGKLHISVLAGRVGGRRALYVGVALSEVAVGGKKQLAYMRAARAHHNVERAGNGLHALVGKLGKEPYELPDVALLGQYLRFLLDKKLSRRIVELRGIVDLRAGRLQKRKLTVERLLRLLRELFG